MRLESKTGVTPFYENYGEELDIKRYRLDTSWKVQSLLTVIPNEKFSSVLEVGCGGGLVLKGVSEIVNADKRIGIDIATSMLTIAQRECLGGLFVRGDAEQLPFKNGSIDLVILSDILEHIYYPDRLLREALRVGKYIAIKFPLEKCAVLILFEMVTRKKIHGAEHKAGHLYAWGQRDVFSLLNGAGLKLLKHKLVEPPEEIRYYNAGERFSELPFGRRFAMFLEKTSFKISRRIYRFLFGSTLVAFVQGEVKS